MRFSLSFWITDPEKGMDGVRSQVMLALWDAFGSRAPTALSDPRHPHPRRRAAGRDHRRGAERMNLPLAPVSPI